MTNFKNIKTACITLLSFQIITPNFSLASDSVSENESSYEEENVDTEEETTPRKKTQHFCLWEDCRDEKVSFASAQELYEHVRDEHAVKTHDHHYKCYWQGCHFEKAGDRHMHRHFLSHCDSVHIKYGAIHCEKCTTKLYYIENRSSHKKRCTGKPPKRATLAKEGFHCRWKNCRDKDAKKIKDGEKLYEHIEGRHITKEHGKMKACLWQGCNFRPNISEHRQPAVFREAILRHCAKEHADFRPFKCPIQGCEQAFYSNATLGDHKKRCCKAKGHQEPDVSFTVSSLEEDGPQEVPEASEISPYEQSNEDDDSPPMRRSQRLKKRKAQKEAEPPHPRIAKRARSNKAAKTQDAPAQAIIVHDVEDTLPLPQAFDAPVPLTDWTEENAVSATVIQDHMHYDNSINIATEYFYEQPTLDTTAASTSLASGISSVMLPAQQFPPVPPPTASNSITLPSQNMIPAPPPRALLGLNQAPPSPSYFVPTNPVVIIQPKIYTCRWMGGCGLQFGRKDLFLQHVQQAHLLKCWLSNCGEGPYLNEQALIDHMAKKHGCH